MTVLLLLAFNPLPTPHPLGLPLLPGLLVPANTHSGQASVDSTAHCLGSLASLGCPAASTVASFDDELSAFLLNC